MTIPVGNGSSRCNSAVRHSRSSFRAPLQVLGWRQPPARASSPFSCSSLHPRRGQVPGSDERDPWRRSRNSVLQEARQVRRVGLLDSGDGSRQKESMSATKGDPTDSSNEGPAGTALRRRLAVEKAERDYEWLAERIEAAPVAMPLTGSWTVSDLAGLGAAALQAATTIVARSPSTTDRALPDMRQHPHTDSGRQPAGPRRATVDARAADRVAIAPQNGVPRCAVDGYASVGIGSPRPVSIQLARRTAWRPSSPWGKEPRPRRRGLAPADPDPLCRPAATTSASPPGTMATFHWDAYESRSDDLEHRGVRNLGLSARARRARFEQPQSDATHKLTA